MVLLKRIRIAKDCALRAKLSGSLQPRRVPRTGTAGMSDDARETRQDELSHNSCSYRMVGHHHLYGRRRRPHPVVICAAPQLVQHLSAPLPFDLPSGKSHKW